MYQCTYSCFPGVSYTSVQHNILSVLGKKLAELGIKSNSASQVLYASGFYMSAQRHGVKNGHVFICKCFHSV